MTKLEFINKFILQWFFIRLARVCDDNKKQIGWKVLKWVVPLTGWKTDYIFVGK